MIHDLEIGTKMRVNSKTYEFSMYLPIRAIFTLFLAYFRSVRLKSVLAQSRHQTFC